MQYEEQGAAYASMQPTESDPGALPISNQNCVSKYRGVSWIKANQKWKAQITIDGKQTYLGLFDSEVEAAFAYDEHAIQLGKPVNFATQEGQKQAAPKRKLQGSEFIGIRPSKYKGVNWCRFSQKWKAQIQITGKKSHLGCFDDEDSAARRYDEHAGPAGKPVNFPVPGQVQAVAPRKHVSTHPGGKKKGKSSNDSDDDDEAYGGDRGSISSSSVDPKTLSAAEGGVVASPYKGVSWKQGQQQWRAQIQIDGTMHYLGYFDTQEEAARKYDDYASSLGRPLNFPSPEMEGADDGSGSGPNKKARFVASKAVRAATAARAASEAAAALVASAAAAGAAAVAAGGGGSIGAAALAAAAVAAVVAEPTEAVAPHDDGATEV